MTRRSSKTAAAALWCWRRRVDPAQIETWAHRLRKAGQADFAVTEKPGRARVILAAYFESRAQAARLRRICGGAISKVSAESWMPSRPAPPLRIGRAFEIVRDPRANRAIPAGLLRLHVPHGLAFGSGEHVTTSMLLHALARHRNLRDTAVLDLGTGSGILALAARLLGAKKIIATDFDAAAIRTARDNEALNFHGGKIRWQRADVKRLRAEGKYGLVLANLFSGILCEAAAPISAALAPGGELWLSGILRDQEAEVTAAYLRRNMRLVRAARRGKWVMLQFVDGRKTRLSFQLATGAFRKIDQTK
jgi:ribosomal protein L11 methyltransferase